MVAAEHHLEVVAERELSEGEQIFISYGDKASEEFLRMYGFVPAEFNPHERVRVLGGGGQEGGAGAAPSFMDFPIPEARLADLETDGEARRLLGTVLRRTIEERKRSLHKCEWAGSSRWVDLCKALHRSELAVLESEVERLGL